MKVKRKVSITFQAKLFKNIYNVYHVNNDMHFSDGQLHTMGHEWCFSGPENRFYD